MLDLLRSQRPQLALAAFGRMKDQVLVICAASPVAFPHGRSGNDGCDMVDATDQRARDDQNCVLVLRADGGLKYELKLVDAGVLHLTAAGFWSLDDVEDFLVDYKTRVDQARRQTGSVALLIDLSTALVQSGAVAARFASAHPDLFTVEDKRAYLVSSALAKMQWRRSGGYGETAVFDDREHALAWLKA